MPADLTLVQQIAIWALPVLLAITVHEVAHGYVARMFGDDTAARAGRLTLNPLSHIDPIGTIIVPLILVLLPGNFLFGWAKPVPVNANRLRNPKRDMAIVAAAGPLVNGVMAVGWALLLRIALMQDPASGVWLGLRYMAVAGVLANLVLMVLNLLPVPPLDGGRVLVGLLPTRAARVVAKIEPYGLLILIGLMVTGLLGPILIWPLMLSVSALMALVGVDPRTLF